MRYQGGKHFQAAMIARQVAVAGRGKTRYVEPFVGGGSVLVRIPATFSRYAYDIHPDLIAMWLAVQDGWSPPRNISKTTYDNLKKAPTSALRGFVGFGASYSGQWFTGYAHEKPGIPTGDIASRWLSEHQPHIAGVHFECADYRQVQVDGDCVVYADPPYDGTYPYSGVEPFDTTRFWRHAQTWVQAGAVVLVSEYHAPPGWIPVRTYTRPNKIRIQQRGSNSTEMLYRSPLEAVHSVNRTERP